MTEPAAEDSPLHILEIHASNFMLIEALDANVAGDGLVTFAGPNANGKTGALTAIEATLRGGASVPELPVKAGAERGETSVVLGQDGKPLYTVTRTYHGDKTALRVEAADGVKMASPQRFLDSIISANFIDPLVFASPSGCRTEAARNDRRVEMLLQIAPLKINLKAHDAGRKSLFDDRTQANKRVEELTILLKDAARTTVVDSKEEDESVYVEGLARLDNAESQRAGAQRRHDEIDRELHELEREIKTKQERAKLLADELMKQGNLAAAKPTGDAATLKAKLAEVRARNVKRREEAATLAVAKSRADDLAAEKKKADDLKSRMDAMDRTRDEAIAAARFPFSQLTIDNSGTLAIRQKEGGAVIPFSQASTAQRMKVAFAVTSALRPKLRDCIIRQGNDLDDESVAQLARIAKKAKVRPFMERILGAKEGIVIEFRGGKVVGTTGGAS